MSGKPDTAQGQEGAARCGATGCFIGRALSGLWSGFADVWAAMTAGKPDAGKEPDNPPPMDQATAFSAKRTSLSLKRSFMAAERTMMAWIRTALSMISFGFTIGKFFEYLQNANADNSLRGIIAGRTVSPYALGFALIFLGIAMLVAAAFGHARDVKALESEGLPHRRSLSLLTATAIVLIGIFAFILLALNL